jgi:glycine cleavage system H protein
MLEVRNGARGVNLLSVQEKKYTEDHEWIELSADGKTGTIGITQYAAKALGDIVFVELPEVGLELAAKDTMGAVESVKSASDLYAPIGGTIVEKNSALEDKPGTINKGPEGDGWIAKIEIAEGEDMSALMDAEAYRKHTEE